MDPNSSVGQRYVGVGCATTCREHAIQPGQKRKVPKWNWTALLSGSWFGFDLDLLSGCQAVWSCERSTSAPSNSVRQHPGIMSMYIVRRQHPAGIYMHCNSPPCRGLLDQPYLPVAKRTLEPVASGLTLNWTGLLGCLSRGSSRLALLGADPPEKTHQCGWIA